MISVNDILHVINEIHQYSLLLLELKGAPTFGIFHSPKEKVSYFRMEGKLGRQQRVELVQRLSAGDVLADLWHLTVDQFLQEIDGKKTRHIWLETVEPERKELAFLSISELKAFLRTSKNN